MFWVRAYAVDVPEQDRLTSRNTVEGWYRLQIHWEGGSIVFLLYFWTLRS